MLPAANRLTDSETFRSAVRSGRRAGGRLLVAHLLVDPEAPDQAPLVGFTVSKAVGNAVVRNRVKRRLRHLTREHLSELAGLPGRGALVVRALPPSSSASYDELGQELARSLARCRERAAEAAR